MASAAEQYAREIHDELKYWTAWLPGSLVQLGDVGTVDDVIFNRRSSLAAFGVAFTPTQPASPGDLTHSSSGAVSLDFQATGQNQGVPGLPAGEAGVGISFSRDRAVVFAAVGTQQTEIADIVQLSRDLKDANRNRDFPAHYVVVTAVVAAASATVLIAQSEQASLTLKAGANAALGGIADLANADAHLSITSSRNMSTQYVAAKNLTPLFKVMGFRTHWWNGTPTTFEALGAGGEPALSGGEAVLEPADFDGYAKYVAERKASE